MLKIGMFSKLSRVSVRMLRHYDEIGLIKPVKVDAFTGYRYYGEEQLALANQIESLKALGFSLHEIAEMLQSERDTALLERYFHTREEALRRTAEETAYRLRLLETAREGLRKDGKLMNCNITVKTIPQRTVASYRTVIPSYSEEGLLWDVLMGETASLNLIPDDPCLCCAVFHDEEFKEADVEVEVQKSVKGRYPDTEHVVFKTEPAVTVASGIYNGPYLGLDDAMRSVAQWVSRNGYEVCSPVFCIYHVSPHETEDQNRFVTEICYPIAKK